MSAILTIILTLITSGIFIAAGRMVFSHSGLARLNSTPLACFFAGLGIWYIWVLVLHGLFGANLAIVWYTFLASTIALGLVLTKILKLEEEHAFFWPQVGIAVALLLPALGYLTADGPVLWAELSELLKNTDHMLRLGGVADAAKAIELDIFNPAAHLASQIVSLPVMLMMGGFKPAVAILFNCVVLVLAAAELARLCHVHVRWHNVVFVAALTLFGVTLFNPFFVEPLVFSAYPDILTAGALFALFVPLMRNQDLPQGMSCIPYGLIGLYAVGCSSLSMGLLALFAGLYIARDVLARRRFAQGYGVEVFMGWAILILMPLFGVLMLDYQTLSLGFGEDATATGTSLVKMIALQTTTMLADWPIITMLMMGFPLWGGFQMVKRGPATALVEEGGIVVPSLLALGYVIVAGGIYLAQFNGLMIPFGEGFIHYALHLQFLILLPLWRLIYGTLRATFPSQQNGVSGALSLVTALMFVGVTVTNSERLTFEPDAPLDHTLRVAEALKAEKIVGWRDKIGVLDGTETRGYYAVALSYGLRHHSHVRPVLQELANAEGQFDKFHDALIAGSYDFLWVHTVTPDIAAVLGNQLRPDYSYLYQVTPAGLTPLKSYAHSSYTYKSASYVPSL